VAPCSTSPFPGPPGPPCPRSPSPPCHCNLCGQRRPSPLALTPLSPISPPWMNGRRRPKLAQTTAPRHAIRYDAHPSPRPDPPDTARQPLPPSGRRWTATTVRRRRAYLNSSRTSHFPHAPLPLPCCTTLTTTRPCTTTRAEPLLRARCCSCPCSTARGRRRHGCAVLLLPFLH
jgi:hypothetical protein